MEVTQIWKDYEKGMDYLNNINLFSKAESCYNFVNGDQWKGLKYGAERPPQLNILLPMMKSSTALVGQNNMAINYLTMNYGANRQRLIDVCKLLNENAAKLWEKLKMDKYVWDILQEAYIAGDSFMYFYDDDTAEEGKILSEMLDTTNIMFGDEQQQDIQKQPYILVVQRKNVDEIKSFARKQGVNEDDIANIQSDDDTKLQINGEIEVKNDSKLTFISKLYKKDGAVYIARATKDLMIQPETELVGIKRYPIAKYTWKPRKGLARGDGDVWDKIPNQISINKSLFRLEQAVRSSSYPIKVYQSNAISASQVDKLSQPGANVSVNGTPGTSISEMIAYLQPANISSYAASYWQDLITLTRDLSGSGDNLENVNPEQASGTAIQAVRDAKTLNVNMQVAAYKQFVEDVALIWYEMLVAYNPNGVVMYKDDGTSQIITKTELEGLKVDIKIDVTPTDSTYSALRDYNLKALLDTNIISFEEYVGALGKDSTMPVAELETIVEERQAAQEQQFEQQAQIQQIQQMQQIGGAQYEM